MLSMEVLPTHSMAHVRREARRYFGETLGLEQESTNESTSMLFSGTDGYVRLEFNQGSSSCVVLHSKDFDEAVTEFARLIV